VEYVIMTSKKKGEEIPAAQRPGGSRASSVSEPKAAEQTKAEASVAKTGAKEEKRSVEDRLTDLENWRNSVSPGLVPGLTATPTHHPGEEWVNGMSTPDSKGRVRLQEVENRRAEYLGLLAGKNATLPTWFYVSAAEEQFPELTDNQRNHIRHNTGTAASSSGFGRWGRAVDISLGQDSTGRPKWIVGDTQTDAWALEAKTVQEAVNEVDRKVREIAGHTASDTFEPRR
jgi:hypothetical protein